MMRMPPLRTQASPASPRRARWMRLLLLAPLLGAVPSATAQPPRPATATTFRTPYLDRTGVVRWRDDNKEVTLFGANYVLPSASDFRAAGYLGLDRRKMIDEDMAHFARMGWDGLRLTFWGDWESSDREGNLIANEHLDLLDYLIAKARERGIYMLFSPIQTYNAGWPDALVDSAFPGFARHYSRGDLGTKPEAIAAQANYLRQILDHVNPYTGTALKNEPSILFIELVNEPWHHSEDVAGSVRYIDTLARAIRATGCTKLLFYNVSQDFAIGESIRKSSVPGLTFGWYPTGLNSGHELEGNYLRTVDAYPDMPRPELARMPRLVYEFDSADMLTGYMYPAMMRAFRTGGVQLALMFSYDMLGTASRNLGWQTHYLNLAYTPRKAMSAIIGAEVMRRLPRGQTYGAYPRNTRFGDFRVSYEENLGELVAPDAFLHTGPTRSVPPDLKRLTRIAGVGSSPMVAYDGTGIYFLDKVRDGVWRLEVYPDAVPVEDPFALPSATKIVTRAIDRSWPMRITLPDLGGAFHVQAVTAGIPGRRRAVEAGFDVRPGVYMLSAGDGVDAATLPSPVPHVGFAEYHPPPRDTLGLRVIALGRPEYLSGNDVAISARVVDTTPPDSVTLSIRATGTGQFRRYRMQAPGPDARQSTRADEYRASIPPGQVSEGAYEYAITVSRGSSATTFPENIPGRTWDWNFDGRRFWKTNIVRGDTPLRLFVPGDDATRLAFTRIGDDVRRGLFRLTTSGRSGAPAFHLELPVMNGRSPEDYSASLVVAERIAARENAINRARALMLDLRGLGARQVLHVTLVERDGTSWTAPLVVDSSWSQRTIPLADLKLARAANLPLGYPGQWNYWTGPAADRGGSDDRLRPGNIERLQIALRPEPGVRAEPGSYGVEIESVSLVFEPARTNPP